MTEDSPNMLNKLTSMLDKDQTPEEQGQVFGNMMTNMMKAIRESPIEGTPEECTKKIFGTIFGNDMTEKLIRNTEIKKFLLESLSSHSLTEAVTLTRNHFSLPEGFTVNVTLDLIFP